MTDQRDPATTEQEIATAPGDLPPSEVARRIALQRSQFRHENTIVPPAPAPGDPVEIWATSGEEIALQRAVVYFTTDGTAPQLTSRSVSMEVVGVDWQASAGFLTQYRAMLPAQEGEVVVRYRIAGWWSEAADPDIWAQDGQGFWYRHSGEEGITTFAYRVEAPAPSLPAWVQDAVIYQIFLDRFHPGTTHGRFPSGKGPQAIHGGTLEGVRQALPYLKDLGVTCLWLTPLTAAPSYHRYDTTDFYTVDARLGSNDDLRRLVSEAHDSDLRILLDFVPSHLSREHPAFRAAHAERDAADAGWFHFYEWPGRYRSFLDMVPALPSIDTSREGARGHLIGAAVQWLREYDVDGFRIDHAIGPSMDFWVSLRTATRAIKPDCFTVGEVTDTPDAQRRYRNRLDAVMDFLLARALRLTFGRGTWSVSRFDRYVQTCSTYFAGGPGRISFLDNHDMERFLYVAGQDTRRLELATLCLFTLESPPVVYYGTEIGLSHLLNFEEAGFGGDAEARGDMVWDPGAWNVDLLAFYRRVIHLRRERPALRYGTRRTVWVKDSEGTLAYVRADETGEVMVVFNLSAADRVIPFYAAARQPALVVGRADLTDASVTLGPWSGAALITVPA